MQSLLRTISSGATLVGILNTHSVSAQDCFYPDGNLAVTDAACSTDGGVSMCCPFEWQCLTNGLCELPAQNLTGRYTCTDQTWQSSDCPQICTNGNTAPGDESMAQCSDGSWCCNGDGNLHCCNKANTDFISLPEGRVYASITSQPSPTSPASSGAGNSPASTSLGTSTSPGSSSSGQISSSNSASSTTSAPASFSSTSSFSAATQAPASSSVTSQSSKTSGVASSTVTSNLITTETDGSVSTIVITSIQTAASASTDSPSNSSSRSSSSHLGLIVGLAVGIPVFLLACAIIACLFWRRRRAKRESLIPSSRTSEDEPAMSDKFGHQVGHEAPDGRAPEIDSYPVALNRTKSGHKSELEGSIHSPAMSNWSGKPPGYSPVTPNLNAVAEEPAELWGGYVPYRPPRDELPEGRTT